MTLVEQQRLFCELVCTKLVPQALALGYEVRFGEALRTPEQAQWDADKGTGIACSLHCERLAIDLILDRDGQYLTRTEDYEPLGTYWEGCHELARWGGRFTRPDGNHFSLAWGGRA